MSRLVFFNRPFPSMKPVEMLKTSRPLSVVRSSSFLYLWRWGGLMVRALARDIVLCSWALCEQPPPFQGGLPSWTSLTLIELY